MKLIDRLKLEIKQIIKETNDKADFDMLDEYTPGQLSACGCILSIINKLEAEYAEKKDISIT